MFRTGCCHSMPFHVCPLARSFVRSLLPSFLPSFVCSFIRSCLFVCLLACLFVAPILVYFSSACGYFWMDCSSRTRQALEFSWSGIAGEFVTYSVQWRHDSDIHLVNKYFFPQIYSEHIIACHTGLSWQVSSALSSKNMNKYKYKQ